MAPTYAPNAASQPVSAIDAANGKLYWYGMAGEPIAESDAAGTITDEYIFFGGKRVARRNAATGSVYYYFADHLGTSRVIVQAGRTAACYEADDYPFGGERTPITNTCPQNYKFDGKERDAETGADYFGARYYTSSFGRWLSPDWSSSAEPVPYANFSNPQTLNLYAFVANSPITHADLDGHATTSGPWLGVFNKWHEPDMFIPSFGDCDSCPSVGVALANPDLLAQSELGFLMAQNQQPQYQNPQNEAEARLSNVVYNETSSLRPNDKAQNGAPGSAADLQNARAAIAEIANTVTEAGHPERVAPSELTANAAHALGTGNPDAVTAHNASLSAARTALAGSHTTNGATQYRINRRDTQKSINGEKVTQHFGPFPDTGHRGWTRVIIVAP